MDLATAKEKAVSQKGAPGFEPGTSRSAVECSTTELYPRAGLKWKLQYLITFVHHSLHWHCSVRRMEERLKVVSIPDFVIVDNGARGQFRYFHFLFVFLFRSEFPFHQVYCYLFFLFSFLSQTQGPHITVTLARRKQRYKNGDTQCFTG